MARKRNKVVDEKRITPLHFQTWGDMMTNLLTLFILLCSFAKEREAAFFAAGIGSFINAIKSHGLPGLLPSDTKPILLDAYDDRFLVPMERRLEDATDTSPYDTLNRVELEQVPVSPEAWLPDAIYFPRGSARLGQAEKEWLRGQFPLFLRKGIEIEVIGHAWKECDGEAACRKLSLRRALAVIGYLNEVGGVPLDHMYAKAYGEARPLVEGENDPGLNRRVNFRLVESR